MEMAQRLICPTKGLQACRLVFKHIQLYELAQLIRVRRGEVMRYQYKAGPAVAPIISETYDGFHQPIVAPERLHLVTSVHEQRKYLIRIAVLVRYKSPKVCDLELFYHEPIG